MSDDGVAVRRVLDTGTGLARRLVVAPPGSRFAGAAANGGELWFVIAGSAALGSAAGTARAVGPDTGVWLPPGTEYELRADGSGEVRMDSVVLPTGPADADGAGVGAAQIAELAGCEAEVTGDRRFRVLFGPGRGCEAATQFVGEIPPGRAPTHSHTYDEVVLILAGEGVLHTGDAGDEDRPLAAGSCVHLPPGTPHCLENTGRGTLRVLGVFHPGGSPAAKTTR